MSNKTPLLRMIFLVMFLIIILVIFSTRISNNRVYNDNVPFFEENFIWKNKNKAYTLLLHSITFTDSSISAYSIKLDTLMTFYALQSDFNYIYNQLDYVPYTSQQCIKCHSAKQN